MNANVQYLHRAPEIRFARLNGWTVDVPANRLQRGDVDVRLTPKAMAVLRELMQRQGTVVRRDDLLGIVWRDGFPTDDVLTHAITELRRALDDDPRAPKIIETIPKVGYRLVGAVETLNQAPDTGESAATTAGTEPGAIETPARPPWPLLAALVGLALLCLALPVLRRPPAPTPIAVSSNTAGVGIAPTVTRPFMLTSDPSREQFPSLSPDGGTVAYAALSSETGSTRILLKSLDAAAVPVALTDPQGERDDYPVWAPDGKQIAFLRSSDAGCSIHVVPALGGQGRRVASCGTRTLDYIDWSADGRALLVTRHTVGADSRSGPATVHRIEIDSGEVSAIAYQPMPEGEDDLQPKSSPDGHWIAFRRGAVPYSDLFVMPASGGEAHRVTALHARIRGFAWMPDSSRLLFSSDHEGMQALYRIALDGRDLVSMNTRDALFPAVARRAPVLVYEQESILYQLAEFQLGSDGKTGPRKFVAPSSRSDWSPVLSPSGKRLAFTSMRSGSSQLWVHEFANGTTFPITRVDGLDVGFPQWSPDESSVLFVTRGNGASVLMRATIASGRSDRMSAQTERVRYGSYSRDGQWIYFSSDRSGVWQVWRMRRDGSAAEQLSRQGGFDPRDHLGDGAVYYTKETDRGLFRLDLKTRAERRVSWMAGYWNMDTLALHDNHVYFLQYSNDERHAWLARSPLMPDVETATPETVDSINADEITRLYQLDMPMPGSEATLAEDLSRIVAVEVVRDETDLMAASLDGGM